MLKLMFLFFSVVTTAKHLSAAIMSSYYSRVFCFSCIWSFQLYYGEGGVEGDETPHIVRDEGDEGDGDNDILERF